MGSCLISGRGIWDPYKAAPVLAICTLFSSRLLLRVQASRQARMCSRQEKDQCHRQERYTRQSSGGCHSSSSGGGCHSSGGGGCHSSGGGGGCHRSGGGGGCHSSGGGCHSSGGSGGGCHGGGSSGCHGKPQLQQQQQQQQIQQLPSQKLK
ncbi:loricrin-like [Dromaius novaehollandiae]|uniref:loricrin-like n=1 Tax=Dromaius novaehollandiae TaxID=8790 RepID=UPI00311ED217